MELATRVQILDETVSLSTNAFGKGMNLSAPPPSSYGLIVEQSEFFSFG